LHGGVAGSIAICIAGSDDFGGHRLECHDVSQRNG
jgi:hypothetical protein